MSSHKNENSYLKFYGTAFEITIYNLLCIWGGYLLNDLYSPKSHWILIVSVFFSITGTIYFLFIKLIKNK